VRVIPYVRLFLFAGRCGPSLAVRHAHGRAKWLQGLRSTLLVSIPAARAGAQVPEKFTNLKVFPKDVAKQDLVGAMREFSSALGVRCGY
jgi:hypothetical protein